MNRETGLERWSPSDRGDMRPDSGGEWMYASDVQDEIAKLKEALAASEAKQARWVSVEERLPEGDGVYGVLVYDDWPSNRDDIGVPSFEFYDGDAGEWCLSVDWEGETWRVTHWLDNAPPLPAERGKEAK